MSKAIILRIGTVDEDNVAQGWGFDCRDCPEVQGTEININTGEQFFAGYTVDELREISKLRDEIDKCPCHSHLTGYGSFAGVDQLVKCGKCGAETVIKKYSRIIGRGELCPCKGNQMCYTAI